MPETIFMIHGMWGTAQDWANYRPFFEGEGYRCLATTLPYHEMDPQGVPDPRLGTTSLLDYASFLERQVRQLDSPPVLMGHSMGGLLAQILGARGLARALVLLTPATPAGIGSITPSMIRSFWSIGTHWAFWRKPIRQTFREAAFSTLNQFSVQQQRNIYDRFVYESGRAACEIGFWFLDPKRASAVDAAQMRCPVLVVGAARDLIMPANAVRAVAQKYRAVSTYKMFENQAHMVLEQPGWQDVAQVVAGWLRQLPA